MYEVKAEAVPCLQVGFMLYTHMHISYHHLVTSVSYQLHTLLFTLYLQTSH